MQEFRGGGGAGHVQSIARIEPFPQASWFSLRVPLESLNQDTSRWASVSSSDSERPGLMSGLSLRHFPVDSVCAERPD